jgi:hypothetical protein
LPSGRAAVAVAILMTAVVVACGDDNVDTETAEQEIQQQLSSPTAQIASVSCPGDVKKEEGKTFTCDASLEGGGKTQVTATQTDNRGNATYLFKPGTLEVSDNSVEPVLEESLAEKGAADPKVDCPELIQVKEGETATCTATGAGERSGEITFAWSSDEGDIDSSSVEAPGK